MKPQVTSKSKPTLNEMLYAPHRDTGNTMNPLARMARAIFSDLNIRPNRLHTMLTQWVNDPLNGFADTETRSSQRGNLQKELPKDNITWKTLSKLIAVMNPKKVTLKLEFEWHDGTTSTHKVISNVFSSSGIDIQNMLHDTRNPSTVTQVPQLTDLLDALDDDDDYAPSLLEDDTTD